MPKTKAEDLRQIFKIFFGGLFILYGFFAFIQPSQYPIPYIPVIWIPLVGLIMALLGLVLMFYENEK